MPAPDTLPLFPLTRDNAFALGRLASLRALAVSLDQSRIRLGDEQGVDDLAERIHDASHQVLLQLFSIGLSEGFEIRTVSQAVAACADGGLGPYPAYVAGALVESEWFLDEARDAHGNRAMLAFARQLPDAIHGRMVSQLDHESDQAVRRHAWIPRADQLSCHDSSQTFYVLTSTVGDPALWVTEVDSALLEQAGDAYFVPVPAASLTVGAQ